MAAIRGGVNVALQISIERYAGHTEEVDGFDESPGSTYQFSDGADSFDFEINDSTPRYASSRGAVVGGRRVVIQLSEPHAKGSPALRIPLGNPTFVAALQSLQELDVEFVQFLYPPTGAYRYHSIAAVLSDTFPS